MAMTRAPLSSSKPVNAPRPRPNSTTRPHARAARRPDFDDGLARPRRHRINDAAGVMRADEEILPETAFGSHKLRSLWGWGSGDNVLRIADSFNLDFAYAVERIHKSAFRIPQL